MLFTYTVCLVLFRAVRLTERLGQSDTFLQAEAGTKHAQKNCYFWFFMCVNCSEERFYFRAKCKQRLQNIFGFLVCLVLNGNGFFFI